MQKLRHRKPKLLTPGATARKLQSWELDPGGPTPEPCTYLSLRIQAESVSSGGEVQVSPGGKREGSAPGDRAGGSPSSTGAGRPAFHFILVLPAQGCSPVEAGVLVREQGLWAPPWAQGYLVQLDSRTVDTTAISGPMQRLHWTSLGGAP